MALDKFQPYLFVSAGEQSNKLLTPTYADGIAEFQAQRAQELTGLTVRIEGVQEGTGDPSPENIRPINGRTGLTVTMAGKNLLPFPYNQSSSTMYGITFTVNDDGSIKMSGTSTGNPYFYLFGGSSTPIPSWFKPNTTYFWHVPAMPSKYFTQLILYGSTSWTQVGGSSFTTPADFSKYTGFAAVVGVYKGASVDDTIYPMLELGSTATTYEPYTAQTYPISWQTEAGTVYGGNLDAVSGVLTVDKGYYTITDADSPVLFQTGTNANRVGVVVNGSALSPTVADRLNIMSNIAKADTSILTQSQQAVGTCCLFSAGSDTASKALFGVPTTEDTAAKAIAWLIAQGCAFVYSLATPQTYQLSPTDIKTLAGFNQIYSDAGPVIDIKF